MQNKGKKNSAANSDGQAMVEFIVAIVAFLVLIAGIIQIGALTRAHTISMLNARHLAGANALAPVYYMPADVQYILNWLSGADQRRYTHDDTPSPVYTAYLLSEQIAAQAGFQNVDNLPPNDFQEIIFSPVPIASVSLVKGSDQQTIDVLPIIRHLVINRLTLNVENTVWLTWTEGIY